MGKFELHLNMIQGSLVPISTLLLSPETKLFRVIARRAAQRPLPTVDPI